MSPLRKKALAWVVITTAVAFAGIAGSFAYLREQHITDEALIESKIQAFASVRGFKLEEARKAGYSDTDVAAYFAKADRAELNHQWMRVFFTLAWISTHHI